MKSPKFGLFRGLIAPKPYVPHQNSRTKGTSLGCLLAPEMIPIAHNCAVWAAALSQSPYESTINLNSLATTIALAFTTASMLAYIRITVLKQRLVKKLKGSVFARNIYTTINFTHEFRNVPVRIMCRWRKLSSLAGRGRCTESRPELETVNK